MTILLGLNLLSQILTSIGEDSFSEKEAFLLAERHLLQRTDENRYITPEIGQYFVTNIHLFLLLFNVHYLEKQKVGFRKRKVQKNIITFYTNIKFFIFFLWISLPVIILKSLSFQHPSTSRLIRYCLISLRVTMLFVVGFLRPLVIIYLLKRNMPSFFIDHSEEPRFQSFFITGQSFCPRQENFLPLKSFSQNARWGWRDKRTRNTEEIESKHEYWNTQNLSCNQHHLPCSSNSMPDIDI